MDKDRIANPGDEDGADIIPFPIALAREPAPDPARLAEDLGAAAANMQTLRAVMVSMLVVQIRQLGTVLPNIVDGLTRLPENAMIAQHWLDAANSHDRFLSNIVHILEKAGAEALAPQQFDAIGASAERLRGLIAECRKLPWERGVMFASRGFLKCCLKVELARLERQLALLDAAAKRAAGTAES